jgi:hypothetical protein
MGTVSSPRPHVKPVRSLHLVQAPGADGEPGLLRIAVGKDVFLYSLRRQLADIGAAFSFAKLVMRQTDPGVWEPEVAERYDTLLADDGRDQCDCKGFAQSGRCKHVSALSKLQQLGLI